MFADSGNLEGANGAAKVGSYDLAGQKEPSRTLVYRGRL